MNLILHAQNVDILDLIDKMYLPVSVKKDIMKMNLTHVNLVWMGVLNVHNLLIIVRLVKLMIIEIKIPQIVLVMKVILMTHKLENAKLMNVLKNVVGIVL